MAVKVLITRNFRKNQMNQAHKLLMELRSLVTLRPGYISGQTLVNADNPNKVVVVSTWSGRKRWDEWYGDPKRKEFSEKLGAFLEFPEQIEVFLAGEEIA